VSHKLHECRQADAFPHHVRGKCVTSMPSKLSVHLPFRLLPKTRLGIVCSGSRHGCWSNGYSIRIFL
jgi:hypothetical protein